MTTDTQMLISGNTILRLSDSEVELEETQWVNSCSCV
jgi:hypothetical protein